MNDVTSSRSISNARRVSALKSAPTVLLLSLMLSLIGCSSIPSQPQIKRVAPEACLKVCEALPVPPDGREASIRRFLSDVIERYGECRRDHGQCTDALVERARN